MKLKEAIKKVFDDLDKMSQEEFDAMIDQYRYDELTHLLLYADDPDYMINRKKGCKGEYI